MDLLGKRLELPLSLRRRGEHSSKSPKAAGFDGLPYGADDDPRVPFAFLVLSHELRRILDWKYDRKPTEERTVYSFEKLLPGTPRRNTGPQSKNAVSRESGTEAIFTAPLSPFWRNTIRGRLIGFIRPQVFGSHHLSGTKIRYAVFCKS